jgi:hypothetical protein
MNLKILGRQSLPWNLIAMIEENHGRLFPE